ncbi:MAG: phosphoribosyltransferase family protein [Mycoplasmatales bacterium]
MNLQNKLLKEVKVIDNHIIKLDHILNHQVNIPLLDEIGKDLAYRFKDSNVETILTTETGGIVLATMVAKYLSLDTLVYAKKGRSLNQSDYVYQASVYSYTRGINFIISVDKQYLKKSNVLLLDDFLATGNAINGLLDICKQADCNVIGLGVIVNKQFQNNINEDLLIQSIINISKIENNKLIID